MPVDVLRAALRSFDYLVNIAPQFRVFYVEVPKAACSTIKYLIQTAIYRERGDEVAADRIRTNREAVHNPAGGPASSPLKIGIDEANRILSGAAGYYGFAVVRNPFTRTLSAYLNKVVNPLSHSFPDQIRRFAGIEPGGDVSYVDFLRAIESRNGSVSLDQHWRTQRSILHPEAVAYSEILRFETLRAGLGPLFDRLAPFVTPADFPDPHNVTHAAQRAAEYYDAEAIALVRRIYQEDFAAFGYDPGLLPWKNGAARED